MCLRNGDRYQTPLGRRFHWASPTTLETPVTLQLLRAHNSEELSRFLKPIWILRIGEPPAPFSRLPHTWLFKYRTWRSHAITSTLILTSTKLPFLPTLSLTRTCWKFDGTGIPAGPSSLRPWESSSRESHIVQPHGCHPLSMDNEVSHGKLV